MYSFSPSEEQQMLIDVVQRYAESDLRPAAHDAEEHREMAFDLIEKGWELGVLQTGMPEDFGGFGEYSVLTSILAAEELAFGDMAGAMAVMAPGLFAMPLMLVGSDAQKETYLPKIVEGEWQPYTAAMVEYHFNFDPAELKTAAELDGGDYVLSGEKCWVPFADKAEAILVYADLDGETQAFIVPARVDGLTIGDRNKVMGLNALPMFDLYLDNVHVPVENRLGGADGHDFQMLLDNSRVAMSALAVGVARASFEFARDYAKQRHVLGSFIAQKQSIAFMLAEMGTEIDAIRLLTWEAAWAMDNRTDEATKLAYLALNGAMDMAMMVTDRGVQILGGHGYIREFPVELWFRNGRGIGALVGLAMV